MTVLEPIDTAAARDPLVTRAQPAASVAPSIAVPAQVVGPHAVVGPFLTIANAVTLVRTVAAVTIGLIGVAQSQLLLLVVAYVVYWLGDMADGWCARHFDQETRAGAVFDILSDRACTATLCVGLVAEFPRDGVVAIAFLLSFMVLDSVLSLAFLCWPGLVSPNHFGVVDQRVYRWNWSPLAKATNTSGVILAVAVGWVWVALAIALVVIGIKVASAVRVARLLGADPGAPVST